jgi:hypothetical protein
VSDKGGLGSAANANVCIKRCDSQADCPSGLLCTTVEVSVSGGTTTEGQCYPACPDRTCEWGRCYGEKSFPDGQAIAVCSDGIL